VEEKRDSLATAKATVGIFGIVTNLINIWPLYALGEKKYSFNLPPVDEGVKLKCFAKDVPII